MKRIIKYRIIYYIKLISIFITAAIVLAIGSAIVHVNCHNAMNSTQMVLFDIEQTESGISVTVMDREYTF
ncbi:MAG: hypothetical protein IJ368_00550 [Oscillospiraceae bacterium]|nr:hypothetical protein [Oscillospiraceae bacterium]